MKKDRGRLAQAVVAARKAMGLSQEAVARAAGISVNTVTAIEQGKVKDPAVSTMAALAAALETSIDRLVKK